MMRELIRNYEHSRELAAERIHQLTKDRNMLRKNGDTTRIQELDLERRIRLLYTEQGELAGIVEHLTGYARRVEERGNT